MVDRADFEASRYESLRIFKSGGEKNHTVMEKRTQERRRGRRGRMCLRGPPDRGRGKKSVFKSGSGAPASAFWGTGAERSRWNPGHISRPAGR